MPPLRSADRRPGWTGPLHVLAADHVAAFAELCGDDPGLVALAKSVVADGAIAAVADGGPRPPGAALLLDGAHLASRAPDARSVGLLVALGVEDATHRSLAALPPVRVAEMVEACGGVDLVKCYVEVRPDGTMPTIDAVADLAGWCTPAAPFLLLEPVVAVASGADEPAVGDVLAAMTALRAVGAEPDVWKVQAMAPAALAEVVALARTEGRDGVGVVVLGGGAGAERVAGWLAGARTVTGIVGSAVGRTIWAEPIATWLAGRLDRGPAVAAVAASYRATVAAFGDLPAQ